VWVVGGCVVGVWGGGGGGGGRPPLDKSNLSLSLYSHALDLPPSPILYIRERVFVEHALLYFRKYI
jgi:hypothetical protein